MSGKRSSLRYVNVATYSFESLGVSRQDLLSCLKRTAFVSHRLTENREAKHILNQDKTETRYVPNCAASVSSQHEQPLRKHRNRYDYYYQQYDHHQYVAMLRSDQHERLSLVGFQF